MAVDLMFDGFEGAVEAGWGGFGVVYRARQASSHREVAIKVLNLQPGADVGEAFRRECAAIGSLSGHPNIVTVHGLGETADGRPFIVMEYLHRGSLGDRVRASGPVPWREAAGIGVALAGALGTAHLAGLLHRDVKPENVLVSRFGDPKLGDFGIARLQDRTSSGSGGAAGSLRHLAPEVLAGQPATIASDVYSLGSTLFMLLAGRPPFGTRGDEAGAHLPDLRPEGLPNAVCRVVEEALSRDPADRQESAEELGRQLQDALAAEGSAVPELEIDRLVPPAPVGTRRRAVRAAMAAVALIVTVGVLAVLGRGRGADVAAPTTVPSVPRSSSTTATKFAPRPPEPGSFTDDFSIPRGWPITSPRSTGGKIDLIDGQYRQILEPPPGNASMHGALLYAPVSGTPTQMVRIAVDVTKVSADRADFGVACGGPSSQFPYGAMVDTGGWWRIVRHQEDTTRLLDVRTGRDQNALSEGPHRVLLECTGEGDQVSIRLVVDGAELATAAGARGATYGPGPALLVLAFSTRVEVLFDNFELTYS